MFLSLDRELWKLELSAAMSGSTEKLLDLTENIVFAEMKCSSELGVHCILSLSVSKEINEPYVYEGPFTRTELFFPLSSLLPKPIACPTSLTIPTASYP